MNDMPEFAPYDGEVLEPPRTSTPMMAHNPFGDTLPDRANAGAVAIESKRASAEVQGRMLIAKQYPRDTARAYARAMAACQRIGLAEEAIYAYKRGGSKVEGPSIRLAEELARHWGNIEYGLNELSRRIGAGGEAGESEMEAFAWDLETNTRSSQRFTVRHIRDKTGGGTTLRDERDVYEITANMGSRRVRARVLAILPPELVADAVSACKHTMVSGGGKTLEDRIRLMLAAFGQISVTPDMISARISHAVDQITPDELSDLRGILQSIKEGGSAVKDWFGPKPKTVAAPADGDPFETAAAGKTAPAPQPNLTQDAPPGTVNTAADTTYLGDAIRAIEDAPDLPTLRAWQKRERDRVKLLPADMQERIRIAFAAAEHGFAGARA